MKKFMLIDASDPAETRVVVTKDDRVEEFDREIGSHAQIKGNIYLAKVTRVEPSLQAAFVDYGGNRHGFLPFSEIHPDYYRIPIADREALLAEEAAIKAAAEADEEDDEDEPLSAAEEDEGEEDEGEEDEGEEDEGEGEEDEGDDEEEAEEGDPQSLSAAEESDSAPEAESAAKAAEESDAAEAAEPELGGAAEDSAGLADGSGSDRSMPMTAKSGDQLSADPEETLPATASDEEAQPEAEAAAAPVEEAQAETEAAAAPVEEAQAETEAAAAPVEEAQAETEAAAAPVEEAQAETEAVAAPVEEAQAETEAVAAPAEETQPEAEGAVAPVEEAQPEAEAVVAPVEDTQREAETAAMPAEEAQPETESATESEEAEAEDAGAEASAEQSGSEGGSKPSSSRRSRSRRGGRRSSRSRGRKDSGEEQSETKEKAASDGEDEAAPREAIVEIEQETQVDTLDGDEIEDAARRRAKLLRRYKIQEVIKRGQIMLVQVSKEERGNKGAALTTYLSLPGRYCVLMPNTARGGGISRKIGSSSDRKRLKQVLSELNIPDGMAVIVRTAGSERSRTEIRRDYDYLIRLWGQIRESTLQAKAPALIYEEGNIIKRAIRDLYTSDMSEILVEGEEGYKAAKAFMRNLMPSHARKVQLYKERSLPLLQKYKVESQLSGMFLPEVQLRSGGYLVINVTEALVAIDVNSGRATRERHIEETALKTNLEAAEEVAQQLRLRDLAGLIVIDFIDMEENRHNREVERRLKEAMKADRARIQLGRISPFGLLELSRQRLRPSLVETAMVTCPHCSGTGRLYSPETAAMTLLRAIVEEGGRRYGGEMVVTVPTAVALYLLNHKRDQLAAEEERFGLVIRVEVDDSLSGLQHRIERIGGSRRPPPRSDARSDSRGDSRSLDQDEVEEEIEEIEQEEAEEEAAESEADSQSAEDERGEGDRSEGDSRRRRRRGKRGGRRRSRRSGDEQQASDGEQQDEDAEEQSDEASDEASETLAEQPQETDASAEAEASSVEPAETEAAAEQPQEAASAPEESEAPKEGEAPVAPETAESAPAEAAPQTDGAAEPEAEAAGGQEESPEAHAEESQEEESDEAPEPQSSNFSVVTAPDPDRPKRQGWWNRLVR